MMNSARFRELEGNLTGIMRKVFEVVPIQESWDASRILYVLADRGIRQEPKAVMSALNRLSEYGLVVERARGEFQRVKVKEERANPEKLVAQNNGSKPAAFAPSDPMTSLGALAQSLRKIADQLDESAIAIEEKHANTNEQLAKFKQLSGLLREMGNLNGGGA